LNEELRRSVQGAASEAVSIILSSCSAQHLAAQERAAADSVAEALVRWNQGRLDNEQVAEISSACNDILEAVRVRRKELRGA
jgi:hypothetical protein